MICNAFSKLFIRKYIKEDGGDAIARAKAFERVDFFFLQLRETVQESGDLHRIAL